MEFTPPPPKLLNELRPLFDRIYYVVGGAVEEYFDVLKKYPRLALAKTIRGAANQIFDLMRLRTKEAFADLIPHSYAIRDEFDSFLVVTPTKRIIKFNKLNPVGLVHAPTSMRSKGFYEQLEMFDDGPKDHRTVTAGYLLDFGVTKLVDVVLQCQRSEAISWRISVPPGEFGLGGLGIIGGGDHPSDKPSFDVGLKRDEKKDRDKKAE